MAMTRGRGSVDKMCHGKSFCLAREQPCDFVSGPDATRQRHKIDFEPMCLQLGTLIITVFMDTYNCSP